MVHGWPRVRDGTLAPVTYAHAMGLADGGASGCWKRVKSVVCPTPRGAAGRSSSSAKRSGRLCVTPAWSRRKMPRTRHLAWRAVAQRQLWDPACGGGPGCGGHDARRGAAEAATSQRPRLWDKLPVRQHSCEYPPRPDFQPLMRSSRSGGPPRNPIKQINAYDPFRAAP